METYDANVDQGKDVGHSEEMSMLEELMLGDSERLEDVLGFNLVRSHNDYNWSNRLLDLFKGTFDKAKAGDPHAQLLHARHLIVFADNIYHNWVLDWLKKAYESGEAEAAYILGCVYTSFQEETRRGVPEYLRNDITPDDSYAYECFSFAAEKGDVRAMAELGRLLTWGAGCERDIWEADKWFKATQGRVSLPKEAEVLPAAYSDATGKIVPRFGVRICQFDQNVKHDGDKVQRFILDSGVFVTVCRDWRSDEQHVLDVMIPMFLRELVIPEGMQDLAYGALAGVANLERVTIPSDWMEIGERCFFNCSRLRSITLPDSLESIGSNAFGCDSAIPCSGLSSFHVPKRLTRIAWDAFGPGAMAFDRFTCDPENREYMVVDGILYSRDGSVIVRCPQGRQGVVEVPKSVEFTNEGAFTYCDKLTRITFLGEDTDPGPELAYVGCSESLEKDW